MFFKTTIEDSGLFRGYTDWHSHLLPGVDDGIKTFDEKAIDAYTNEAMSSDYDHLLSVSVEMTDKINDYCCKK